MKDEIINSIYGILDKYFFEQNNDETRYYICKDLSRLLDISVFDYTDIECEKRDGFNFMVQISNNKLIPIIDYIENYNIYNRSLKLKKIIKKN